MTLFFLEESIALVCHENRRKQHVDARQKAAGGSICDSHERQAPVSSLASILPMSDTGEGAPTAPNCGPVLSLRCSLD